jgi:iron complex outermembrane receptor protein
MPLDMLGGLDLAWSTATTQQLEREVQPFGPDTRIDLKGVIGVPEFKFTSTLSLGWDDWEVLMQNRFIGDGQQNDTEDDAVNLIFAGGVNGVASHDIDFVDSVWYTDLSLTYRSDMWSATLGVNNLFEEDPPLIDVTEGPNRNNAVSSTGYDFYGRTFFATVAVGF